MRRLRGVPAGVSGSQLFVAADGLVHLPMLVAGRLVEPPPLTRADVDAAFAAAGPAARAVRVGQAQAVREPYGERVLVVPTVSGLDLAFVDPSVLAATADVPLDAVVAWLERAAATLLAADATAHTLELLRAAPYPMQLLEQELATFATGLSGASLRAIVDAELGHRGVPGAAFLDGWVTVDGEPLPEPGAFLAADVAARLGVADHGCDAVPVALRALPTRQLHVTAGNSPLAPFLSTVRLALTKGVGTVKLAAGGIVPGALLAWALAVTDAGEAAPLQRQLSVVYWPGGDERVEQPLLAPGAVDRIVVWGDVGAVTSLRARAPMTRVVSFDPRYGVSLVGREAFASPEGLAEVAARAAADVCLHDQKACNASHVQYVEGDDDQVAAYAEALRRALAAWDAAAPPVPRAGLADELTMLRRGRLALADWYPAGEAARDPGAGWTSGVVVSRAAFDVLAHPLARFVVVRPVASLDDEALPALSRHVAAAGVWPEERRLALRTAIAARGVSSVLPLGRAAHTVPGAPHDGMLALSQLVDWARA